MILYFLQKKIAGVEDLHHIHIWSLDEHRIALEAHVVVTTNELTKAESIKQKLKKLLQEEFNINHSTLELEHINESACDDA